MIRKMKQAQYGNPFGNGGFYQSYSSGEPGSGYQEFHFDGSSDMDDILDKLFGEKGGFHGTGGFGGRSGFESTGEFGSGFGGVHEERGQNIETEVPISFEEAVFGCDKGLRFLPVTEGARTLKCIFRQALQTGSLCV